MTSDHTCHAMQCETPVPRRMLFCRKHWYMLTPGMRDEVWSVYQEGQEVGNAPVTMEYVLVTERIINWLARKEGLLSE
jgi:hypothetical protein